MKNHKKGNYYVIDSYGYQFWYVNDKCHRDNDQPAIIWDDGTQEWYIDDKLHRDNDKPAIIKSNGTQKWYQNGLLHRINNHAVIWFGGTVEYWYEGINYNKQEYFDLMLSKGLISQKEHFAKLL